ncbi:hypothetical protein NONO_c60120 [Nocardia nova SH22a]|uniref:Uncharacterized protein n=1 Tax=Nocardia nova SH22a TaxID=1415166 RepID=W5TPB7_9NOCA|nr:hypothetical protein [Nocardia nova]AHH20788.1 hypothetical protein NONO_c60120 [Nocardia nova SH22a]
MTSNEEQRHAEIIEVDGGRMLIHGREPLDEASRAAVLEVARSAKALVDAARPTDEQMRKWSDKLAGMPTKGLGAQFLAGRLLRELEAERARHAETEAKYQECEAHLTTALDHIDKQAVPQPDTTRIEQALVIAWDDGNATGLDGWTGPGRGAGDVDDEAIRRRNRSLRKLLTELAQPASVPPPVTVGYLVGWQDDDSQVRVELDEEENIVSGASTNAYAYIGDAREFVAELGPSDPDTQFKVYGLREMPNA